MFPATENELGFSFNLALGRSLEQLQRTQLGQSTCQMSLDLRCRGFECNHTRARAARKLAEQVPLFLNRQFLVLMHTCYLHLHRFESRGALIFFENCQQIWLLGQNCLRQPLTYYAKRTSEHFMCGRATKTKGSAYSGWE